MKFLFICVENTCRSQMAEGFAKQLGLEASSAGLRAGAGVNRMASQVMDEVGIDISDQFSKSIDDISDSLQQFDYIVSLCEADASEVCPANAMSKGQTLNWNLKDPNDGRNEIEEYRKTRDIIDGKIKDLIGQMKKQN